MTNYWRRVVSVITAAALAAPAASSADQKITLRSGATLHGVASMDGEVVVVAIGESEVRVAFDSIASIQPDAGNVFTAPVGRGTELLLLALEGKVHEPGSGSSLGLLTEAYQVSPDDPRVAYWYASDLVAKGYGESASEVFRKNREGIEGHYPALSRKLAERIERRLAFEELPADLVERVDTINRGAAGLRPSDSRDAPMHAYFRVVDQDGQPVSRDDFRVSVSGNNEELEGFGRGYYLFSYTRGSSSTSPCTLRIQGAGLKPAEHEFTASPWGVKDAGTFAATRFTERDLLELTTRVVDAQGAPVSDASVTLRRLANGATESSNAVTDDQGEAAFQVYPGRYSASPHASGFKSVYKTITVSTGQDAKIKIELHNAISARLRVEWKSVPTDGDDPSLTGEEQLQIKDGVSRPSDPRSQWIGLAQIADKLTLAPGNAMYGRYGRAPSAPNWIGVARPESADESPRELYDSIDLDSIESWRAKSKPPAKVPPRQYANDAVEYYQVSPGDVVVGVTAARDPNTNRVIQRWYKGLVEALPE